MDEQVIWIKCLQQAGMAIRWLAKYCGCNLVAWDAGKVWPGHSTYSQWQAYHPDARTHFAEGKCSSFEKAKETAETVVKIETKEE